MAGGNPQRRHPIRRRALPSRTENAPTQGKNKLKMSSAINYFRSATL